MSAATQLLLIECETDPALTDATTGTCAVAYPFKLWHRPTCFPALIYITVFCTLVAYCSDCEVSSPCRLCLPSYLPVIVYTLLWYAAILNTVSLHSTLFDYCTVRYGTGRVGRYGQLYTYLNSGDLQLSEHAANNYLDFSPVQILV